LDDLSLGISMVLVPLLFADEPVTTKTVRTDDGPGQRIPNFSDRFIGNAPDIGAHQRGAPPIQYGVGSGQP